MNTKKDTLSLFYLRDDGWDHFKVITATGLSRGQPVRHPQDATKKAHDVRDAGDWIEVVFR